MCPVWVFSPIKMLLLIKKHTHNTFEPSSLWLMHQSLKLIMIELYLSQVIDKYGWWDMSIHVTFMTFFLHTKPVAVQRALPACQIQSTNSFKSILTKSLWGPSVKNFVMENRCYCLSHFALELHNFLSQSGRFAIDCRV